MRKIKEGNDLQSKRPDIALDFDLKSNYPLKPNDISYGSSKTYAWKCHICGHTWNDTPAHIVYGRGCSECRQQNKEKKILAEVGSIASKKPELLVEWDAVKNKGILPNQIPITYNKKVNWNCSVCGMPFKKTPKERCLLNKGCPFCAERKALEKTNKKKLILGKNDLAHANKQLAEMWNYEKNGRLTPEGVAVNDKKERWFNCPICGRPFKKSTYACNRNKLLGCDNCKQRLRTSFPEQALFFYIKRSFPDAINSYRECFSVPNMELDIFIPSIKTGIEYDGYAWHKDFDRDKRKYYLCRMNGIRLIRVREAKSIYNKEIADLIIEAQRKYRDKNDLRNVIIDVLESIGAEPFDIDLDRDEAAISGMYLSSLKGNSLKTLRPDLAEEWSEKNGILQPGMYSAGSETEVWWICSKCGRHYKESIVNRVNYSKKCPDCFPGKTGNPIYKPFDEEFPSLSKEWDYEKNYPKTPHMCTRGMKENVGSITNSM